MQQDLSVKQEPAEANVNRNRVGRRRNPLDLARRGCQINAISVIKTGHQSNREHAIRSTLVIHLTDGSMRRYMLDTNTVSHLVKGLGTVGIHCGVGKTPEPGRNAWYSSALTPHAPRPMVREPMSRTQVTLAPCQCMLCSCAIRRIGGPIP